MYRCFDWKYVILTTGNQRVLNVLAGRGGGGGGGGGGEVGLIKGRGVKRKKKQMVERGGGKGKPQTTLGCGGLMCG